MNSIIRDFKQHIVCSKIDTIYRMAGNFGRNLFWQIDEFIAYGEIYFGGWASLMP